MHLRVVDGNDANQHRQTNLISYVVNEHIAFDAGALGLMPLDRQRAIKAIFLSHSHTDHIATLPLLVDNVYRPGPECIVLYANPSTIHNLREHVFNDRIWPDVFRLSDAASPFIEFRAIAHGQSIELNDVRVTAFDVNHTIPTLGFVIDDGQGAVALVADTAPCDAIWRFLSKVERLKAVFLEISFPNSMQWLAQAAKHLTPNDFFAETKKLERQVIWYVTHNKPEFTDIITLELSELQLDHYQYAQAAYDYLF